MILERAARVTGAEAKRGGHGYFRDREDGVRGEVPRRAGREHRAPQGLRGPALPDAVVPARRRQAASAYLLRRAAEARLKLAGTESTKKSAAGATVWLRFILEVSHQLHF